jgi:hypothetical protein
VISGKPAAAFHTNAWFHQATVSGAGEALTGVYRQSRARKYQLTDAMINKLTESMSQSARGEFRNQLTIPRRFPCFVPELD